MKTFITSIAIILTSIMFTGCSGGLPEATAENCLDPDVGQEVSKASHEDQMKFAQECQKAIMKQAIESANG